MSTGDDPRDPARPGLIILPAGETFDGRERTLSRAAYELQISATVHSASCGHPGYVPGRYLASLGAETAALAAELCAAGMWERFSGGYRLLDWDAVEFCLSLAREREAPDPQAIARAQERERQKEREALVFAPLARAMVAAPPCAACGAPATRIELVAPGQLPAQWEQWPSTVRHSIRRQREPGQWWFLFKGIAAYNGYGDPIDASRAGKIAQAFQPPLSFAQVHTAGFYDDAGFCEDCDAPYCYHDWHVTESGFGYCPCGHGKSLDWYW